MAKIPAELFVDWQDKDIVYARDYKREREIMRVAINDNYDKISEIFDESALIGRLDELEAEMVSRTDSLDTRVTALEVIVANLEEVGSAIIDDNVVLPNRVWSSAKVDLIRLDVEALKTAAESPLSQIEVRTSDPSTPEVGRVWLRSDL